MKGFFQPVVVLILLSALLVGVTAQETGSQAPLAVQGAVGTAFTYQGRLTEGGSPASGNYDLRFRLFGEPGGGSSLGEVKVDNVPVAEGLFTVLLDFGSGAFTGEARWLEIGVRPAGGDSYTDLSPRQALTRPPMPSMPARRPGPD